MSKLQPTYAIISAVYNVDRYLQDFLKSLDAQTISHDRLRVILVNDGSTDGSADTIDAWAAKTDIVTTVVHQENAGQGAARNAGIALLEDETWVTFTDPDDFLGDDAIHVVDRFLEKNPSAVMACLHQQDYWEGEEEENVDRHPLRFRFDGGDQLVDVDRFPRFVQLSSATAFFNVNDIVSKGLSFDSRVQPNFEDGHFVQRYLLGHAIRHVGFLGSAAYHYRRRSDGTSTIQTSGADPRRYTDVVEFGYLSLLKQAEHTIGYAPAWMQNVIIYDLNWIFRSEEGMHGKTAGLSASTQKRFHSLVAQIRPYLDDVVVEDFDLVKRSDTQFQVLLHGYSEDSWHWDAVRIGDLDADQNLVKLHYRFTGTQPDEEFRVRGLPIQPRHAKVRDLTYLGEALLHERIVWLWSEGEISVSLNGRPMPVTFGWPDQKRYSVRRSQVTSRRLKKTPPLSLKHARRSKSRSKSLPAEQARAERLARTSFARRTFKDAWVLMDRDVNAHDNAEHLFKYLRKHRRDINAWFVVKKGSDDWNRLKKAGYRRLIAHGSVLWRILCLNATHIISSHADHYVYSPFKRSDGPWRWKYVFLQHGITKDDMSRWLSPKPIAGLITATAPEWSSIAGTGTEYSFSTKEVALTGFPRHDRLNELASKKSATSILVMPTWRQYLMGETVSNGGEREKSKEFYTSEFALQWQAFLSSSSLLEAATSSGLTPVFMPHPNLKPYLDAFTLPEGSRMANYDDDDVQELLAEAALVVTDYSSIAFDAALIRRPVVYFQFDASQVFSGNHVTRRGYFSYAEDGFGPVAETVEQCVDHVVNLLATPGQLQSPYAERVEKTFTVPVGQSCRRVTEFIESLSQPLTRKQARTPITAPAAPQRIRQQSSGFASSVVEDTMPSDL